MAIDWVGFTPWPAFGGGILIGLAASLLFLANGRIAGISGIVGGLLKNTRSDVAWRYYFLFGLLLAPLLWWASLGRPVPVFSVTTTGGWVLIVVGGLLVGFGTRLANGCTSGHGVCGLARLSLRSLAAVATFLGAGLVTVYLVRHWSGA